MSVLFTVEESNKQRILDILAQEPPVHPGRHKAVCDISMDMVGNGFPDAEIFRLLRQWIPDTDKPDKEFWDAIKGAHKRNPQPTPTSKALGHYRRLENSPLPITGNKVTFTLSDKSAGEVPEGDAIRPIDFLRKAFQPGELICINNETAERAGKETIVGHGHFRTIEGWEAKFEEWGHDMLNGSAGCWIRINPFKKETEEEGKPEGDDKHVSDFRNLLVEFDTRSKAEQWEIYKQSKLPIRFVIDSGGDSLHAWIAVDAVTAEEFKARQERVYEFLEAYLDDKGNKNPSRYSRLPGVARDEKGAYQTLVAENIGEASWQAWEESLPVDDGLTDIQSPEEFLKERMELDPYLIVSLLRENSKMSMTSQSKAGKSWLLLWLALCIGSGQSWLGHQCVKQPVLYVNLELKANGANNRVYDICEAMGIDPVKGHMVDFWNLRGKSADIAVMTQRIIRRIKHKSYKLVIIDPGYKCLGWRDENKAGDITDFQNHVESICTEVGASVIVVGHTPKGDISTRAANDRQSGSGVWSRDPDVVASFVQCTDSTIIEKHGEDVVVVSFSGMREDVTPKPFLAKWEFPILTRLQDSVPKKTKQLPERAEKVLKVLSDKKMAWADLLASCKADHGAEKQTFNRALKDLQAFGLAESVDGIWQKIQPNTFTFGNGNEV